MAGRDRGSGARAPRIAAADGSEGEDGEGQGQADSDQHLWLQGQREGCARAGRRARRGRRRSRSRRPAQPTQGAPPDESSQRAAKAAAGITETVARPPARRSPHPWVSRITSRNSAAVRPADSSASPTSGRRSRRALRTALGRLGPTVTPRVASRSRSGTWTRKIDCQREPRSAGRRRRGRSRAPIVPAAPQIGAASSWLPRLRASSSIAHATATAPPSGLDDRGRRSTVPPSARSHRRAMQREDGIPLPSRRGDCGAPTGRPGAPTAAQARLNAVRTQETPKTVPSNSRRMSGSPSVTIEESARTTPTETARAISRARRPPGAGQAWAGGLVLAITAASFARWTRSPAQGAGRAAPEPGPRASRGARRRAWSAPRPARTDRG